MVPFISLKRPLLAAVMMLSAMMLYAFNAERNGMLELNAQGNSR